MKDKKIIFKIPIRLLGIIFFPLTITFIYLTYKELMKINKKDIRIIALKYSIIYWWECADENYIKKNYR